MKRASRTIQIVQTVTASFGLATLCTLPILTPLLLPTHTILYHLDGSATTLLLTVALFVVLLGLVLSGLLLLAEKFAKVRIVLWTALIAVLPWSALKLCCVMLQWTFPHPASVAIFASGIVAAILALLLWRPAFLPYFDRLQHFVQTLLSFASLSTLLILGQLFLLAWQVRNLNTPQSLHTQVLHAQGAQQQHSRVIWILLDELSYQQVYERRYPGLLLPAFDRVAQQSVLFTHTIPIGLMTEYVVPSLVTGIPSDAIRASADGRKLFLHTQSSIAPTEAWQPFDSQQTVFRDALDRGYSTAIAGWYNPYCRTLATVVDRCAWSFHAPLSSGMATDQSVATNLLAPLDELRETLLAHLPSSIRPKDAEHTETLAHIHDYRDLLAAADTLLNDPSATFVFLHLPIPHPDGIYDRHTHQFATHATSYLDNLVLADDTVAHLRTQLEQRGEWDSAIILITGDHAWRTVTQWRDSSAWTAEEQTASHEGQFDDRPAYILKLPDQHQSARIETPFQSIHTRDLLDALMDRRIQNAQDLSDWATRH
ncbi:hypothetical protein BH10ACI4_BH10ACI4_12750 [soil metagenome]